MNKVKRTTLIYLSMVALLVLGNMSSNLAATVAFTTLGFFWSFITNKEDK